MTAPLELLAIREIAHAFLVADRPGEVYQFALDRLTPILGASFSLVMQLGEDGELLRPVAQHEWPARHRNWIGALRVRVGDGPSGLAVAEQRLVEVPDLYADPTLEAWFPVAEELGFRSIVAAPLIGADGPSGAIAFYFAEPVPLGEEQRALVRLVADQLAATADKASLIDALRRTNAALAEANEALEREARAADDARRARDRFLVTLTARVRETLDGDGDTARDLAAARAVAQAAEMLAGVESGTLEPVFADVDPRGPLLDAVHEWRAALRAVPITHGEPTVLLPTLRSDPDWLRRLLRLLLGQVVQACDAHHPIHVDVELGRGFLAHRLQWRGAPLPDLSQPVAELLNHRGVAEPRHPRITALDLALVVSLTRRLGGDLQRDEPEGEELAQGVTIVFPVDA